MKILDELSFVVSRNGKSYFASVEVSPTLFIISLRVCGYEFPCLIDFRVKRKSVCDVSSAVELALQAAL